MVASKKGSGLHWNGHGYEYRLDRGRHLGPPGCGEPAQLRDRPRSRPSRVSSDRAIHVRRQIAPNWYTPAGVAAKRRQLERKGLPCFKGWRFITLTCDHVNFDGDPLTAYLVGRDHMRRFMAAARKAGLWSKSAKWAWKLEFHSNGWPHWHLLIDRKRKFSHDEMRMINRLWGFGRTNCRRIAKSRFGYQFKYAFKGVYDESGSGFCVPQWFLDYVGKSQVSVEWVDQDGAQRRGKAEKPDTFGRVRFWQTSRGFYTGDQDETPEPKKPVSCILPRTVGEISEDRERTVIVCAREINGRYLKSMTCRLQEDWPEFVRRVCWEVDHRAGLALSVRSFVLGPAFVANNINQCEKWQLQRLNKENRMTLRAADRIRHERRDLQTC